MFKMYKMSMENTEASSKSKQSPNPDPDREKYEISFQELVKQFLLALDNWPQPACSEYYNQIIEGNLIEYLLSLYEQFDEPMFKSHSKKPADTFNYSNFVLNIILAEPNSVE